MCINLVAKSADNRLIGALTSSDVLEAVEEEIQEEQTDDNLDNAKENSYIYGDVQVFGEDDKKQD